MQNKWCSTFIHTDVIHTAMSIYVYWDVLESGSGNAGFRRLSKFGSGSGTFVPDFYRI
jgi:hypothetical protein